MLEDHLARGTEASAAAIAAGLGRNRFDAAVVMGSGWANTADLLGDTRAEMPVADVSGFSAPVAAGHVPTIRHVRTAGGRDVLVYLGRTHWYEGLGFEPVTMPVRVAMAMGARTVVLTNASGGVNPDLAVGDALAISDHLNFSGVSPLTGGPNFVDLTGLYSTDLRRIACSTDPTLRTGVYAMLPGPHFETPAENAWLRSSGADVVGMSTVLEAIAAFAGGADVLALSVVSAAAPGAGSTIDPNEVLNVVAARAAQLAPAIVAAVEEGQGKVER